MANINQMGRRQPDMEGFEDGVEVEDQTGQVIGSVYNTVRMNGALTVNVKLKNGSFQNYAGYMLRPHNAQKVAQPTAFAAKVALVQPLVTAQGQMNMSGAERPGVFDFGSLQIFALGDKKYIIVDKSRDLLDRKNQIQYVMNDFDPGCHTLIIASDESAEYTPLEQSESFRQMVAGIVAELLASSKTTKKG